MKKLLKSIAPPVLISLIQKVRNKKYGFYGDYQNWQEAVDSAEGYDAPTILERVREATLKVKHGEAIFERDSVCFYHEEYRWPTLACLLRVAAENDGVLRVIDFGGALGSFYFQHRKHFQFLKEVRWSVVEQAHYVECGRKEFQDESLRFYESMSDCLDEGGVDVVFCSCVLQYLADPYAMLEEFSKMGVKYILLDRTPFIDSEQDRLTVQDIEFWGHVKIPAWFFSKEKFLCSLYNTRYSLYGEFLSKDVVNIDSSFKGMFFKKLEDS